MKMLSARWVTYTIGVVMVVMMVLGGLQLSSLSAYACDDPNYNIKVFKNNSNQWTDHLTGGGFTYAEGQSIPFRVRITDTDNGEDHHFTIEYAYYQGGKYFIDYLTTPPTMGGAYDYIKLNSGPSDPSGINPNWDDRKSIPVAAGSPSGASGQYLWAYDINLLGTLDGPTNVSKDSWTYRSIGIDYEDEGCTDGGWVVYGGHLAESSHYGPGKGAANFGGTITGMYVNLDGYWEWTWHWPWCWEKEWNWTYDDYVNIDACDIKPGGYLWTFNVIFAPSFGSDFAGTVLLVDGNPYTVSGLPYTATFLAGSTHTFAFQSPLVVTPNGKQYIWTSTTATSPAPSTQGGTFTVGSSDGTVTGHYQAQYYLTMTTNVGTVTPGNGWWNAGTVVPIGANAGSPDYLWGGWTGTNNISVTGGNPVGNSATMNSPVSEAASWTYSPPPSAGGSNESNRQQPVIMINTLGNIQAHPVTPDGALINNVVQNSPDGSLTFEIPAGTIVLNAAGDPQYKNYSSFYHTDNADIIVELAGTPTAPQGATIVRAYQVTPSGVIFKIHDATITAKYEPGKAPQGKSLVWAFYDEKAQKWVDLETGGVVAGGPGLSNSLSCKTSHLTYFAILAK